MTRQLTLGTLGRALLLMASFGQLKKIKEPRIEKATYVPTLDALLNRLFDSVEHENHPQVVSVTFQSDAIDANVSLI